MSDGMASKEDRDRGLEAIRRIREEHRLRMPAPEEPETRGPVDEHEEGEA